MPNIIYLTSKWAITQNKRILKPKEKYLLDGVSDGIRSKQYPVHTERSYCEWICAKGGESRQLAVLQLNHAAKQHVFVLKTSLSSWKEPAKELKKHGDTFSFVTLE